jgi:hypothetical protein
MLHSGSLLPDRPGRGNAVAARREPRSGQHFPARHGVAMTATFEHTRKVDFAPAAKAVSIKRAMAGVWPPAMIGLGLVLTLAWSGSLLWLFVRMIIALV